MIPPRFRRCARLTVSSQSRPKRIVRGLPVPSALTIVRAASVACMIIVGVVYNGLVPGTGSAPAWVSVALHTLFPLLLVVDWTLVRDRTPLPWSRIWWVLPYPVIWLVVVLIRGVTDGWVPYGFLLPERGAASLAAHIAGLFVALIAAASLVWALSRFRIPRTSPRKPLHSDDQLLAQP